MDRRKEKGSQFITCELIDTKLLTTDYRPGTTVPSSLILEEETFTLDTGHRAARSYDEEEEEEEENKEFTREEESKLSKLTWQASEFGSIRREKKKREKNRALLSEKSRSKYKFPGGVQVI